MVIDELRDKANRLPLLPGVYLMLDEKGEVIYVGKAKKLKNRVTSYFRGEHEPKTAAMVEKVRDFNVIVAASEFEALILENSLIKRHQPHYNILLRDDKTYPYSRMATEGENQGFSIVNKTVEDGAKYFGPFGSRGSSKEIIDTVCKALLLPTCGRKFPRDFGRDRPCLNYHMGNCLGYCGGKAGPDEYGARMRDAELILSGKSDELRARLESEMYAASDEMKFELAAEYRDRLKAIENLSNRQSVIGGKSADADAFGFYRGAKCCFSVLHFMGGCLVDKEYELMDEPLEDDAEVLSALVRQYYARRGAWPKGVLLPMETEDMADLEELLTQAAGRRVYVDAPKRGEKHVWTEKAMVNAREESLRFTTANQRRLKTLEWLRDTLALPDIPHRIESYDISNTGNFGIVASMVVFENGRPLKRDYRKFKIKTLTEQNDVGAMREVLTRRFTHYLEGDEKFGAKPDLLLIDGGAVHAGTAEEVLRAMNLTIPTLGMVKDDRHRTRALIYSSGQEVGIDGNPAVFALVGNIQEETHRFAIEYHRSLRTATIGSALENIPGVGEKRRNELLKQFKTVKAIREASVDELAAVVPKSTAKAVWEHFHREETKTETTEDSI